MTITVEISHENAHMIVYDVLQSFKNSFVEQQNYLRDEPINTLDLEDLAELQADVEAIDRILSFLADPDDERRLVDDD